MTKVGNTGTCKFNKKKPSMNWIIDNKMANEEIKQHLFDKVEYAGLFELSLEQECKKKVCQLKINSNLKKINKGSASSVKSEHGYCNFHTHPYSCYIQGDTLWGWPSGEDMRETIIFSMKGTLFHLVYAIEGIYLIQVNPNIINKFKDSEFMTNLAKECNISENELRGVLISLVESYFQSSHNHRTIDYNKNCVKQFNKTCFPEDWVHFANSFNLDNFFEKKNKCSGVLPCNGVPDGETPNSSISLKKYVEFFDIDVYTCSKEGVLSSSSRKSFNKIIKDQVLKKLAKAINNIPTKLSYGGEKWKKGQWFSIKLFYNKFQVDGQELSFKKLSELYKNDPVSGWKQCFRNLTNDTIMFDEENSPHAKYYSLEIPSGLNKCNISK